jgi:hypothetical protein
LKLKGEGSFETKKATVRGWEERKRDRKREGEKTGKL